MGWLFSVVLKLELKGKHRYISVEWNNNAIPYGERLVWVGNAVVLGVLQNSAVRCVEMDFDLLGTISVQFVILA